MFSFMFSLIVFVSVVMYWFISWCVDLWSILCCFILLSIFLFMACQSALWYKYICLGGIIYVRPWCEKVAIIVLWSDPKSSSTQNS